MKILKNSLIISSYLLLTAVFFASGYAIGNTQGKNAAPVTNDTDTVSAVSQGRIYFLALEDGTLNLYRISGGEREVMESEKIAEDIYPSSDIKELKNGITFDNLPDAQLVFEDFVS